jgi:hypothetical protein
MVKIVVGKAAAVEFAVRRSAPRLTAAKRQVRQVLTAI